MARRPCPNANEDCKYFNKPGGCFADQHHPDFPKAEYRTSLEKRYRIARAFHLCRLLHEAIHLEPVPEKPNIVEMREYMARLALERINGSEAAS